MYSTDNRIVITLDAGGTNFVFGAIQANEFIIAPITLPSLADNLETCLNNLEKGFHMVIERLPERPVAISFAFPGPADYPQGIIGGELPNFPSFREGVALGAFLEEKFHLPVFINNDGDLYAYGEAIAGVLPEVNERLAKAGSSKRYKNLVGYTMGTGFGCGIALGGRLHLGDNSCGAETWCMRNYLMPECIVEEGVSIRAVKRIYGELTSNPDHGLEPKDICAIAAGETPGDQHAAIRTFEMLGQVAGDAMANAVTLVDGLIAIGGGLTGAAQYFLPALLRQMNGTIKGTNGQVFNRTPLKVYNLDDEVQFAEFARGKAKEIVVPGTLRTVTFDPERRIGIAISKLGASRAISLGAYAFALSKIDAQ